MSSTRKAKNGFWKGAKKGLEKGKNGIGMGQERDWNGVKNSFKRYKKRNLAKFEILERARMGPRPLSRYFQPVFHRFAPFSTCFSQFGAKIGKKSAKKWRNGKGKKSVLSCFFPVPLFYLSFLGTYLVYSLHQHLWVLCNWGLCWWVAVESLSLGLLLSVVWAVCDRGRPLSYGGSDDM